MFPAPSFPRRGGIYMVDFSPSRGSEQAGQRPAVVVSNNIGNEFAPVVIVAAITSTIKKAYPFTVHLQAGDPLPRPGTILCNQLMTVSKDRLGDYRGRLNAVMMPDLDRALRNALML